MSSAKWIVWIIIALLILGGGYWYFSHKTPAQPVVSDQSQNVATTTPEAPIQPAGSLQTESDDSSDAALIQDTESIDAGMSSLSSDYTSIDSSLNDKPVQQ